MKLMRFSALALLILTNASAYADVVSAQKLADKYTAIANNIDPTFTSPSINDGQSFFNREIMIKGKMTACASCHTSNPANEGKHIITNKPIRPLAPAVNEKRFVNLDKVEKNFSKHCHDIISRDCTAKEKANFISYLISVNAAN